MGDMKGYCCKSYREIMGDSFILPRACRGGLGPKGARYREEEEDVTNRGSDCVTTLIKMGGAIEGKQKGNVKQGKKGQNGVEKVSILRSDSAGLQRGDNIYIKTELVPLG